MHARAEIPIGGRLERKPPYLSLCILFGFLNKMRYYVFIYLLFVREIRTNSIDLSSYKWYQWLCFQRAQLCDKRVGN